MRLLLPNRNLRSHVVAGLRDYFNHQDRAVVVSFLKALGDFYQLPPPKFRIVKKMPHDWLGFTRGFKGPGCIVLMHPETWASNRIVNTEDEWVEVALHELYHWVTWVREEEKADDFSAQWMT